MPRSIDRVTPMDRQKPQLQLMEKPVTEHAMQFEQSSSVRASGLNPFSGTANSSQGPVHLYSGKSSAMKQQTPKGTKGDFAYRDMAADNADMKKTYRNDVLTRGGNR